MTETTHTISPLRQRMIEDMRSRKFAPKTQTGYIRAVKRLAGYLGKGRGGQPRLGKFQCGLHHFPVPAHNTTDARPAHAVSL